ncbi:MAG: HNH endonuclease [Nocardioides sp.]|nr:HNH endonuclease [Nocardioides sp.]
MTSTLQAPSCGTAAAVAERVRGLVLTRDDAEREILFQATVWADLHPPAPGEEGCARGTLGAADLLSRPEVDYGAGAGLAAALSLRSESGDDLIAEGLEIRHRLPRVGADCMAGEVQAWRARRIARFTLEFPDDVAEAVDAEVAAIAQRVGATTLDRVIDAAMMRLHPAEHAARREQGLSGRQVRLVERCNKHGLAEMIIDADAKDLHDFDRTVSEIAALLIDSDSHEVPGLDERRAVAVGILADPARALALLEGDPNGPNKASQPRKRAVLVMHIAEDAVLGAELRGGVGRADLNGGVPLIEGIIRDWCGREDTALTVRPIIDQADHESISAYEVPDRIKFRVDARDQTCVFAYCTRPAQRCDHDHNVPHGQDGATCDCNIAPLCRRHHRLKTHKGWVYTVLEPGAYLWSSPHGDRYFRDNQGTGNITPRTRPRHDGCFRSSAPPEPPGTATSENRS